MKKRLKHLLVRHRTLARTLRRFKYAVQSPVPSYHDDRPLSGDTEMVMMRKKIHSGIKGGLVKDLAKFPYYTKFERFFLNNHIDFEYYNIHASDWAEKAAAYDFIVWRPMETPWELDEAREKVWFMETVLKKPVYPSFDMLMLYGNKSYQSYMLRAMGYPAPDTFVSYDYREAAAFAGKAVCPIICKADNGSASQSVRKISSRRACLRLVRQAFKLGVPEYWPGVRTKNKIYLQQMLPCKAFDLRVSYIDDDHVFGYYRKPPAGDFRASGLSPTIKRSLPFAAMDMARDLIKRLGLVNASVDFLQSSEDGGFKIIEITPLIRVITDEQLHVNGTPGRYRRDPVSGKYLFSPGRWWLQELILRRFLEKEFGSV